MKSKADIVFEKYAALYLEKRAFLKPIINLTQRIGTWGKNYNWGQKLLDFSKNLSEVSAGGTNVAKGIDFLKQYSPSFNFVKDKAGNIIYNKLPENSGFIQNRIGDFVNYVQKLKQGINPEMSMLGKIKQFGKNLINTEKELWTSQTYKVIDPNKPSPISKFFGFENKIVGDKVINNSFLPSRKIYGYTPEGHAIVKKRMLPRALGYSFTPGGTLALGLGTGGDVSKSTFDAMLWTPALRPIGEIKLLTSGLNVKK